MTQSDRRKKRRVLLIFILILSVAITGALIGTIARYVTTQEVSDSAVGAKFGLGISNTIDLFSDSYISGSDTIVNADTEGKKIIAPGTSGSYKFNVTGTSEVAYKVSADVTVEYSEEWADYAPLEFSVDGETWTNLEDFETNLGNALASAKIEPNDEYTNNQTIHWRWPFFVTAGNDIKDTEIGIAAAVGTAAEVKVTILVIAAQVE